MEQKDSTRTALDILRVGTQWVCYDIEKAPYTPKTGIRAKLNDSSTWGTYDQAMQAVRHFRHFKGPGRVFLREDGITGIDLDKCVDEIGQISEFAQRVITLFDSYTEYSPSGTGIHIWVFGSLLENINSDTLHSKNDRIEMYDHGHYLTFTGKHIEGTPITLEHRQLQLLDLYREVTLKRKNAREKENTRPSTSTGQLTEADCTPYGKKALEQECQKVRMTPEGGRNDQLNRSAYAIGQLIAGNEVAREYGESALYEAAEDCGLKESEILATLRSGMNAGMQEPRHAPVMVLHRPQVVEVPQDVPEEEQEEETPSLQPADIPDFPEILIGAQLREITSESLIALELAEQQLPTLFAQGTKIKRVARDKEKRPIIDDVDESTLRGALTRAANYYRLSQRNGEWVRVPVSPPKDMVQDILSLKPDQWPFPAIEAIVQMPILRADGTILDSPGYDPISRLYYMPKAGLTIPKIPASPTQQQAREAAQFIATFFQDFPYQSEADHANILGLALTTICRQMFRHVPLALIDATKQGTGKGLMTDIINEIAIGDAACAISPVASDEEWDKRITALLMTGATMITIDNVEGVLRSPILAKVLTGETHNGRILGTSKMVNVPQRAIWIANGNNIQLGGDMARRSYRIRMITKVSNPWEREDFTYPDLMQAVKDNRGKIISSLLTIARSWFLAGKPTPHKKIKKMATFSQWAETIGSMLSYAGITGFLENAQELHQEADVDGAACALFLETWQAKYGNESYKTSELIEKLKTDAEFAETLPEPLGSLFLKEDKSLSRKMGRWLSKRNGTPFGPQNLRLVQGVASHDKVATFSVAGYDSSSLEKSSTNAGLAGYVEGNLTLACGDGENAHIAIYKSEDVPTGTTQTPQSSTKLSEEHHYTPQLATDKQRFEYVRDLVLRTEGTRTYTIGKPFSLEVRQVTAQEYMACIEQGLRSPYSDWQTAAYAEIDWHLKK